MDDDKILKEVKINQSKKFKYTKTIFSVVSTFVLLAVLGFMVQFMVRYESKSVIGWSMQPTYNVNTQSELETGDKVYINKYADISQNDVVVIYATIQGKKEYIIKRCVATAGQSVNIVGKNKTGSIVYSENHGTAININVYEKYYLVVDGKEVKEDYIINPEDSKTMEREFRHFCYWKFSTKNFALSNLENEIILANDEIFALGDNRLNSTDSSSVGPFNVSEVIGRVDFVIYYQTPIVKEWLLKFKNMFIIKT